MGLASLSNNEVRGIGSDNDFLFDDPVCNVPAGAVNLVDQDHHLQCQLPDKQPWGAFLSQARKAHINELMGYFYCNFILMAGPTSLSWIIIIISDEFELNIHTYSRNHWLNINYMLYRGLSLHVYCVPLILTSFFPFLFYYYF